MATEGIKLPFSVEADGVEVTIEKLAARMLSLEDATRKLTETQQKAQASTKGTAVVMGAIAGVVQSITNTITTKALGAFRDFSQEMDRATAFGSKFQNLSLQYNTSAEALQKLAAAGKPFNVSVDQIGRSLNLLDRNFSKLGPTFKKFGIDAQELAGKDAVGRFQTIAESIGKIKNPADQAAASFALLKDRSGAFLKLIRDPSGVQGAIDDFERFGLAVSDNAVGALDKLGNQRQLITDIFTSMKTNILGAVASSGALQEAIRVVIEVVGNLSRWIKDNQDVIRQWVNTAVVIAADALVFLAQRAVPVLIDGLTVLTLGFYTAKKAIDVVVAALQLLFTVAAKPTAFGTAIETFKARIIEIRDEAIEGVGKIVDKNIELQNAAANVGVAVEGMRDRIASAIGKNEQFAASLTKSAEEAALTDEQLKKLADTAEKVGEQIRTALSGIQEEAIVRAEKAAGLSPLEQQVNKIFRDSEKQIAEFERNTKKAFGELAIPPEVQKQMEDFFATIRRNASEKANLLISEENERISKQALDRVGAAAKSLFGDVDKLEQEFNDLAFVLADRFGRDSSKIISALDLKQLNPDVLKDVISRLEKMREVAIRAGEPIENITAQLKAAQAASLLQGGDRDLQRKLILDQVEGVRRITEEEKKRKQTIESVVAEMVKNKEITKEEAEKILPKAVQQADLFKNALAIAADAAEILGKNDLSQLVGGLLSAAAAGEQVAKALREAQTSGDKLKAGLAAVGAGIGVAGNIFARNRESSAARGALSGASQGGAFGAQFGPTGAVIGAIAGGLIGFFAGSRFRKISRDAGAVLGGELSKELVKKIDADAQKLGISIKQAALLNISAAISETGKAASTFAPQISQLMDGIASGAIPAKEGIEEVGRSFTLVAEEALKAGRVGDRAMVGLIKRARELGLESPEIKAFVNEQLDSALAGVKKFVAAISTLSDDALAKLGRDSGIIFGAMFDALVSERGIVAAVDALKDEFDTLREKLTATLGEEAVNQILGPFGAAFDTLGNEQLRPIFDGIDGLTQAMKGLANAGFLSTDQFAAMQRATKVLFDEAIAGGADMKTALLAVAPGIQAAITAAEQFGIPLDEDTQKLKELAEQNGITFKTDPQQAMLDVLVAIAEVLGADIPESARRARESLEDLKNAAPGNVNVGGGGATGGTGGQRNVNAQVNVNLGINENPLAAADTAAAMRRATVDWAAEAIEDRIPSIIAAIEGG